MDNTGDSIFADNANWDFGGETPQNFDQHVNRSIPLYREGHDLVLKISDFFLKDGSLCYELGCSTGQLISKLGQKYQERDVKFVGVDREEAMIKRAEDKCRPLTNVELVTSDILDIAFQSADLIVAYYTIQFISPKNRQIIFDRIFNALNWGGAFLLFEKVRAPDARFQDMTTSLYTDFKLDQQYTPEEIISKARSLKGVLEPFSAQANYDLLKRAGFVDYMTVMKYVCFEGILAIK